MVLPQYPVWFYYLHWEIRHGTLSCISSKRPRRTLIVGPGLALLIEQQLPKGAVVEDGCWVLATGGALQGDFAPSDPKAETRTTYVFEYKEKNWILVDTQTHGFVNNPYGIGDRAH